MSSAVPAINVLIVDDEEFMRKTLKALLEKNGFSVQEADSATTAQHLVGIDDFQVVISDINMPGSQNAGIQLLQFIKQHHPLIPVILMTGFSQAVETQEAYSLGAKGFLAKPFKRDELLAAIRSACRLENPSEAKVEAEAPQQYCRVAIDQFISGKKISFEIFIRLSEGKFTKLAHEGENLALERIKAFQARGVDFLYIKAEDFAKYVGFNLTLSRAGVKSNSISREQKAGLLKHASEVILEDLFLNGVNEDSFNNAKEMTENTLTLLASAPDCLELIASLDSHGDPLYAHCLAVSLYSGVIAKQIGWTSPSTLFNVSTAGLFHDIGLKAIDRKIVDKPKSTLTFDEIKLLETHPARGVEILGSLPSIRSDILQIVLQHHETCSGLGYPAKLPKVKINPVARLIAVADVFCELALTHEGVKGLPPDEAIHRMNLLQVGALDQEYVQALSQALQRKATSKQGGRIPR